MFIAAPLQTYQPEELRRVLTANAVFPMTFVNPAFAVFVK
jgi:hypothetical protein